MVWWKLTWFNVMGQCLRPSSDDFPKLAVRHSPGPTRVRESERVVGETITTKTEEYTEEETGLVKVRTVEIVEKLIEKEVLWFVLLHCMSSALLQYAGRFRHLFRMFNYFFFCLAHHRQLSELYFCIILSWIKYSKGHSLPSPLFYRLTLVKKVRVELSLMFTFNIIRMVLINGSNYPARMSYGYFINSVFVKCSF